jgi:sphingolipid delta-4 desaturase
MEGAPFWLTLFAAYTLGAFLSKALWVMIHECAHNLVFRSRLANEIAAAAANLPQVLPMSALFRQVHLRHHAHLGEYALDGDLPSRWEAALSSAGFAGKALWLLFFPLCSGTRIFRVGARVDGVAVVTAVCQVAFDVVVVAVAGWGALLYLTLSFFFSVGLHPLGARWLQEHHIVQEGQETYSYYGLLNHLCFNIGYHTEHHDFASIPWNRLPRLRASAADFYDHRARYSL